MVATQTANPRDANPPTFESVWAALQETDRIIKEVGEKQKKTDELIGNLTNLFGHFTESMIAPALCEKFREFGYIFERNNTRVRFSDHKNGISFEVDAMLENGDKAMLVEVKTQLTTERVNKHIERLEKMRRFADLRGDKRAFLGAVAAVVVSDEARDYALSQGFYLIEPSGETFNITPPNGKPKEWQMPVIRIKDEKRKRVNECVPLVRHELKRIKICICIHSCTFAFIR
jgi:hypothetical protein